MLIPKLIHFIWFPSKFTIPSRERSFIAKWQSMNKSFGVMIWDEKSVSHFIYREFPEYMGVWKSLKNKGKKSDFARYLILYRYGGFYLDVDQEPLKPLEEFMASSKIYCKDLRASFDPNGNISYIPVDINSYDLIIGADNFSVRPSSPSSNILTNCFIASKPSNKFWMKFIENRIPFHNETVLSSFGTWALTDFIRANNPDRFLELPSFYFNFIPTQMRCDPLHFTYSMHHSDMGWVSENSNWLNQR